jgi:phosphoglycerol transferase MdoB-like AlkP superfamily enzyme
MISSLTAFLQRVYESSRFGALYFAATLYLIISFVTRLILAARSIKEGTIAASSLFAILPIGTLYDLITCLYLFAPFAFYLFLFPQKAFRSMAQRLFLIAAFGATLYGLIYVGAVEYFFFDEFNARFNFVAVEYLIYPTEVFVNIWESYPVGRTLLVTAVITLVVMWRIYPLLNRGMRNDERLAARAQPFGFWVILLLIAHAVININTGRYSENRVANELAINGIYSFFNAAMNSEMDYPQFYVTVPANEAARRLRQLVAQSNSTFLTGADNPIARHVENTGKPLPLNVVILLEESLGADFIGVYGDKRGLTPNIDRLAQDSVLFTNVYAMGTRTVRGMEAVSASFPPVPAEAIVKRPNNENMFNWSTVMKKNGYTPTFIYGGFGTFDNMNYFFGNNGYRVVDRTDMDHPNFANIWGVSDEDLFRNAFRVFDEQNARGEKIFSIIMTTSNHKPFTFPEGVPGVPAKGGGREAGVRYSDYAIGKFFEEIKKKPYFGDTMVIIVGDHGARVYGKEDIPLKTYELPLLIHAPKHFAPHQVDILTGQIDLAPTVLGMLNISYDSVFFGKDVFKCKPDERFVLLNHNRDIALYDGSKLTDLNFRKTSATYFYDKKTNRQTKTTLDTDQLRNAASVFQSAYDFYLHHRYHLH